MARFVVALLFVLLLSGPNAAERKAGARREAKQNNNPLIGIWQSEDAVITFEERRLIVGSGPNRKEAMFVADYGITKDNVVFGIITQEKLSKADELYPFVSFVDETFRFRFLVEDDQLIIKDLALSRPRVLGITGSFTGLGLGDGARAKGKGGRGDADDPLANIALFLLLFERELSGTYERTTLEKLKKLQSERMSPVSATYPRPPTPLPSGSPATSPPLVSPPPPGSPSKTPLTK